MDLTQHESDHSMYNACPCIVLWIRAFIFAVSTIVLLSRHESFDETLPARHLQRQPSRALDGRTVSFGNALAGMDI